LAAAGHGAQSSRAWRWEGDNIVDVLFAEKVSDSRVAAAGHGAVYLFSKEYINNVITFPFDF